MARNPVGVRSRTRRPVGAVALMRMGMRMMAMHRRRRRAARLNHHRRGRRNNGSRMHYNRRRHYRSPDRNVHVNSSFSLPGGSYENYHTSGGKQIFHHFLHGNKNGLLY